MPTNNDFSKQHINGHLKNADIWINEEPAKHEPVIDQLFDRGDKVAIIGKSKTRKSFFALQLAVCLASGRSFLGQPGGGTHKVLLYQAEIRECHFQKRLQRMCSAMNIKGGEFGGNLMIFNARGKGSSLTELQAVAEMVAPNVLIVDPLYKMMSGDENNPDDFREIFRWFDSIAEKIGATIVYVHHDKKGVASLGEVADRGSGSGIVGRDFDASFVLTPHEIQGLMVLESLSRNYPPSNPISIEWAHANFIPNGAEPIARTTRPKGQWNRVGTNDLTSTAEELLKSAGEPIPVNDFMEKLRDKGATVRQCKLIRDSLTSSGTAEIETRKSRRGSSSKLIRLVVDNTELPF